MTLTPRNSSRDVKGNVLAAIDEVRQEVEAQRAAEALKWPVSIDGKKIESETYKILGILDKR